MPNCYATLSEVKNELGLTDTDATRDAIILQMIEDASRDADQYCRRFFYVKSATQYYDVCDPCRVIIDDTLSISTLTTDSECDGTFDGETWTQGDTADYTLWPYNEWPKLWIQPVKQPRYYFQSGRKYVKAVGLFGYGDGLSATPYKSTGLTGTLSDASDTTITASASAASVIYPGNTLLIESEQVFVTDVATTTITVERGVNGTTAAAHAAATMYVYKYPRDVARWVIGKAKELYLSRASGDYQSEMIGQYQYQRAGVNVSAARMDELLGKYVRLIA